MLRSYLPRLSRLALRSSALLGGLILATLVPLTVLDIALRYILNAPIRGTFELTQLAMVGVAFLGLGEAQARTEHITIDLLHTRLSVRGRAALDRLAQLVSLVLAVAIAWHLAMYAARSRVDGEISGVLGLPLYLAIGVAAAGFALFGLALVTDS
jgi:TRAP-type transport system small permease protein